MLPDELCDIMLASQKRAYGDGLDQSTLNPYMWVCKVHYYSTDLAFYNYPYTFGGLLARGLYEKYLKDRLTGLSDPSPGPARPGAPSGPGLPGPLCHRGR